MSTTITNPHLTDAELIRAVDEQLEFDEQVRVLSHLDGCEACRHALERERLRKHRLSSLLAASDYAVPELAPPVTATPAIDFAGARARRASATRWLPQHAWVRAAAAIVLLFGALVSITPLRAALAQWIRAQWSRVGDAPSQRPAPAVPTPPAQLGPRVQFDVAGNTLFVEFAAADPDGTLTLRRTGEPRVAADATSADVELIVLMNRLRIVNSSARQVAYQIDVPVSVSEVIVLVAGREVRRLDAETLETGSSVSLR